MQCAVGDVIAGMWQFMNQPWSSYREIAFDVLFRDVQGWDYIGYGRIFVFGGVGTRVGNMSQSTDTS